LILELILLLITPIGCYKILRAWKVDETLSVLISLFFTGFLLICMVYFFTLLGVLMILAVFVIAYRFVRKRRRTEVWR
jgi:uncharacterized membrane protein